MAALTLAITPAVCLLGAGCGRVYFDPIGDGQARDDSLGGSGGTCANVRDIAVGQTLVGESLAGAGNNYTFQGCPDGIDVVYRLTLPAPRDVTMIMMPTFDGSISWSATNCPPALLAGTCASYTAIATFMRVLPAGSTTIYIMIEKTIGTGTTFTLAMQ